MAEAPDEIAVRQAPDTTEMSVQVGGSTAEFPKYNYENAVQEGYIGNDLIFACIREIATSASEAVLGAVRTDAKGVATAVEGRIGPLLRRPNAQMTQFAFLETIHTHLNIAGNVYFYKVRSVRGVQQIYILRPDRIRLLPAGREMAAEYLIDNVVYGLAREDFGHLKLPHPTDDLYGLSPLAPLGKHINLDSALTDFASVFFTNAGVPSGILKLKRQINDQEEANQIRAGWRAQFRGTLGWHQIAILDADADYQKTGSTLGEANSQEMNDRVESRICAALNVPPILVGALVGLNRSTYSNYGEARRSFWEETLMPAYKRIGDFLEDFLGPDFSEYDALVWDFSNVRALAPNETERSTRITGEFDHGVLTLNETRAELGYDPIDGGDVRRVPISVVELEPGEDLTRLGRDPDPEVAAVRAVSKRAAARLHQLLDAVYEQSSKRLEGDVRAFFKRLQDEFEGRLGRILEAEAQATTFDVDALLPLSVDDEFAAAVRPGIVAGMEQTWVAVNSTNILEAIAWDAEFPPVQHALADSLTRLTGREGVNAATRAKMKAVMQKGLSDGLTLRQIADGVPKDKIRGLRSLVRETYSGRARTIARTEIRTAQNQSAAARYKASGVTYVEILDGDDDDECSAANGSRWTVDYYRDNPIAHPNCTRTATPVIE
jgi:HK97 family phage portal protein